MDTLSKETLGLPIFISSTTQEIISSGQTSAHNHPSTPSSRQTHSRSTSLTSFFTSTLTSTLNIQTQTQTYNPSASSPTTSLSPPNPSTPNQAKETRRQSSYIPPTFSPRRESLLSAKRFSQVFDFAAEAIEGAWKKAGELLTDEGEEGEVWDRERGSEDVGRSGRGAGGDWGWGRDLEGGVFDGKARFGDGEVLGSWLD